MSVINLERVVDAIAVQPRGTNSADLFAAILEGIRQGSSDLDLLPLFDALVSAYEELRERSNPAGRVHQSAPVHGSLPDAALRQIHHETAKAVDLGATPQQVLLFVASGLTGRINGHVERAAAQLMAASFDDVVRTIPQPHRPVRGRSVYQTWSCRDGNHKPCRGGWRAPSGWMPCTCTCHTKETTS